MKHAHRTLRHPARPVAAACAAFLLLLNPAARAQDATEAVGPEGPKPRLWIEPRVSAGVTLSDNGSLSSSSGRSEQTIEISPGIRVVARTPRIQGFLDYSLSGLHYLQDTSADRLRHNLATQAKVDLWDNRAFLDLSGSVDDEAISALGTPIAGSLADVNRSETARFRISPYFRGRLASFADYELRYGLNTVNTDTQDRSDITDQRVSVSLNSPMSGQRLGWTANASSGKTDYSLGRDTSSDTAQLGLIYQPSEQWRVTLLAGRESNNVLTLERESYSNNGIGVDWRPSPRTRFQVRVDDRYFGTGHNISLEHRTGLTVWRYTDSRDAVNNGLEQQTASLGSVYDLLDSLFSSIEPDPVRRAQLVQAELLRLGLPVDSQILQNFLSSSTTLQRRQELSVALVGTRSVITFALGRSNTRRLGTAVLLGDDFDSISELSQRSWRLSLAHRLTPVTSVNASLSRETSDGNLQGLDTRVTAIVLGLTTRLAPRTSGSLQLRRAHSDGSSGGYRETSVAGFITHRF